MTSVDIRMYVISVLVAIFFLGYGVMAIIEAGSMRNPTHITYEQFIKEPPKSGWYHITGCYLDLTSAASYREDYVMEKFKLVGLRGMKEDFSKSTIRVMVIPKNPEVSKTIDDMETYIAKVRRKANEEMDSRYTTADLVQAKTAEWIKDHYNQVFLKTDVEGMIPNDLHTDASANSKREGNWEGIDPNYTVIDETSNPSPWLGIGSIILGLLIIAGVVFILFTRRGSESVL